MAIMTKWYRLVGAAEASFARDLNNPNPPTFGDLVDGTGVPTDMRKSVTFDTSNTPESEVDDFMSRSGFEVSTDPNT